MAPDINEDTSEPDGLEGKVLSWLASQGYPLEMRLAQAFRKVAHVTQSEFYLDSDRGGQREIDVVVSSRPWQSADGETWFDFELCVEVKGSPDKPWIVFAGDRNPLHPVASVSQRYRSSATEPWWDLLAQAPAIQRLPLFAIEDNPGYGVVRATFSSSQREDVAYAAVMGAAKASAALTSRTDVTPPLSKVSVVALPVVFIDAPLFKCRLDGLGLPKLSRTDRATLVWRNNVGTSTGHTIVLIVTESGLQSLVEDFCETAVNLGKWLTRYR
ncbi:hypothetical protein [Paractinoplanes globisporus]|uniref:DUF4365 domain-containing protein n=1 Tax=Paractinoplanes globisporus TaxID=113565 RepID=A0ABW6WB45_9ACTN|nr:hypothetical protein [Actinoplanes globisporus]